MTADSQAQAEKLIDEFDNGWVGPRRAKALAAALAEAGLLAEQGCGCLHRRIAGCDHDDARAELAEPTALAYTPDDELEKGVEEFKRLWPDKWEAWVKFCKEQNGGNDA